MMRKNKKEPRFMKKMAMVFIPVMLTGCATIFGNSQDVISIHSADNDAKISVNGNDIGKGNAYYSLPRGKSATVTAEKKGCSPRTIQTEKSIAGLTWLNLFFLPGFIVDAATGAIQKADPTNYTVTPDCTSS